MFVFIQFGFVFSGGVPPQPPFRTAVKTGSLRSVLAGDETHRGQFEGILGLGRPDFKATPVGLHGRFPGAPHWGRPVREEPRKVEQLVPMIVMKIVGD